MRVRDSGVVSQRLDDDVVVLDLDNSTYYTIRGSGVLLFRLLGAGDFTPDDLVTAVVAEYDVSSEIARRDVDAFLQRIESLGLTADNAV